MEVALGDMVGETVVEVAADPESFGDVSDPETD
jgi:hypothetical protein